MPDSPQYFVLEVTNPSLSSTMCIKYTSDGISVDSFDGSDNCVWYYNESTGQIINKLSGYALESSTTNTGVSFGEVIQVDSIVKLTTTKTPERLSEFYGIRHTCGRQFCYIYTLWRFFIQVGCKVQHNEQSTAGRHCVFLSG